MSESENYNARAQEIEMVKILDLDTLPERDLYRGGDAVTECQLVIDPCKNHCWVTQWREDYSNAERVLGGLITATIGDGEKENPDAEPLRVFLNGAEAQELLERIIDGWESEGTQGGRMDDDSNNALDELVEKINALPSTEWEVWDVEDWLYESAREISATTTDERINELVADDGDDDNIIINGDPREFYTKRRDEARSEWVVRAQDVFEDETSSAECAVVSDGVLDVTLTWGDGCVAVVRVTEDGEKIISNEYPESENE